MEGNYSMFIYNKHRIGIFNIDTDEYCSDGWISEQKKYKIIGEDVNTYIYEIRESSVDMWQGDTVIPHKYVLPIGIHKTRLVRWENEQLTLF